MNLRTWVSSHPIGERGLVIDRIASAAGVKPAAVRHWLGGLRELPSERCPAIEAATGVSCDDLRPDLSWDRDDQGRVTGYRVVLAPCDAVCETAASAEH